MISPEKLDDLVWGGTLPEIEKSAISVPVELTAGCSNFIKDGKIDDKQFNDANESSDFKALMEWANTIKPIIESSPGFSLLKISDVELSNDQLKSLYYAISLGLGKLNNRYGELFEVKDRNLDYNKEAIPVSKTNASTGFHTDSTSAQYSPDIVGLLCLQPGKTGGESIISNAANLYQWLETIHPDFIESLCQNIIRDVITPGSKTDIETIKSNSFPIFSDQTGVFKFRYMRYWILSGHERCNMEISENLISAMDAIDDFFHHKENQLTYFMKRGDILFINNNFICHSRTEYTDYEEVSKKRTLVRAWINI